MVNLDEADLLPSEREMAKQVQALGLDRAYRVLERISQRLRKRAKKWNDERVYTDFAFDSYYVAKDWELDLLNRLKMGIRILDDSNTPAAARQRILARLKERQGKRKRTQKQA